MIPLKQECCYFITSIINKALSYCSLYVTFDASEEEIIIQDFYLWHQ
jgi:hypothetical protein